MKKIIVVLLSLIMIFSIVACSSSDSSNESNYMNKLNISSSYKGNNDGNFFTFKFNWKVEETFSATFTHEYDLYWAVDEAGLYEICEPMEGYTSSTEIYELIPGEEQEFSVNVDDKYEGLPSGHYKFVFTFDVSENGGEPTSKIAEVEFDL